MRVAALNDIHGNLPALEAVLRELRDAHVDRIVVGGDVVPGPMTRETLACLYGLDIPVDFLYGNCEAAMLEAMEGRDYPGVPEHQRALIRWTADHLGDDYGRRLASWPKTVKLDVHGLGRVIFCHGTPEDEDGIFTRLTPEERLLSIFQPLDAALVVCGHTHMQFDRMVGGVRVVNAGSVGMPFGDPGADWLLLGPGVQLRHTDYDLDAAAARLRAVEFPWPDGDFVEQYVLHPPSAAAMLEQFTAFSLR
jgi:predicted phosphodiesterase